jgi:hypothetical protein
MSTANTSTRPIFRGVDIAGFPAVAPPKLGRAPRLDWIALSDLLIDPVYQREITTQGARNIVKIAQTFDWAAFSPILVAPAGLVGKFSIIDGQHRAHAAKLIGLDRLPCQIVDIAVAEQARAFGRVNDNVTKMHAASRFHALVAAADPRALAVQAMADEAGVTILRAPRAANQMKPGQTLCTWYLEKFAVSHGRAAVVLALRAIVATGTPSSIHPHNVGLLKTDIIGGCAAAIAALRDHQPAQIMAAFRSFDLGYVRAASGLGGHTRIASAATEIERRLRKALPHTPIAPPARAPIDASAITQRNGVSLPRLKSLERDEAVE